MPDIRPNRDNWEAFCEEPALSNAEWREWRGLADRVRDDDELVARLRNATMEEREAVREAQKLYTPDDWSDMVAEADATRRVMWAELEWLREHV